MSECFVLFVASSREREREREREMVNTIPVWKPVYHFVLVAFLSAFPTESEKCRTIMVINIKAEANFIPFNALKRSLRRKKKKKNLGKERKKEETILHGIQD